MCCAFAHAFATQIFPGCQQNASLFVILPGQMIDFQGWRVDRRQMNRFGREGHKWFNANLYKTAPTLPRPP
jgi:hypothetical protein